MSALSARAARPLTAMVAIALLLGACSSDEPEPTPTTPAASAPDAPEATPEPEPEPTGIAPLTGASIPEELAEELATRPALIVKIENSGPARPQSGLDDADLVLEELVEGGITRFITIFHSRLPDRVGPVRSARPIDVEVGSGFGTPVFAYTGARAEVQTLLRGSPLVAIEEGQAPGFERATDRRSPHNVYLRPEDLLTAGLDRGAEPVPDLDWVFDERPPRGEVTCEPDDVDCDDPGAEVRVAMSTQSVAGFTYDADDEVYRRTQDGQPSTVTGDGVIGAANVVVLAARHYIGGCCDSAGSPYPETELLGGDRAVVLRDGRRYEARWDKPTVDAPLRIVDEDGEPFPMKPGPTWLLLPSASALG
ncbi:DUF3048 domain-containing protein [Nitriliruptoraceae bacterium ZYF776]|nr:DUF3048 domain-containing protein [Profundirhabdus halotolerans]